VVADEEGIVVVPADRQEQVLIDARKKLATEAGETLDDWEHAHRAKIDQTLADHDFPA
jgi:regulator of RNase E activity RraA